MEHTHLFLLVAFFLVHSPLLLLTPLMDTTPQSAPVTVPLRRDVVTTAVAISYAGELPRTECRCICDHCAREEIEHLEYGCFRRHYFAIPPCRECAFIEKYGATTWWFTHSALEQRHLLMHVRALSKLDGSRVTCATDYACASPSTQWIALSAPFWVLVMVMEFIGNKTSDAESKAVAMAADTLVYADAAAPEELGRTILKKNIMNSLTTTLRPALFFCRCITRFILKNLSSNNPNSLIANKLKLATTILDDNEKQLGGCLCLIPIIQELVAVLPRGYSDRYYLNLCEHLVSADFKCVRFQTLTCDNTCPGNHQHSTLVNIIRTMSKYDVAAACSTNKHAALLQIVNAGYSELIHMDHGRSWLSMFLFNNTELHIRFIQDYRHDACLYLETVKRAIQGSVFPLEYIRDDVFLPHMHTLLNLAAKWIQERKIWPFSDLIYILTACYRSKTWPDVNVQLFATCLGAALEYESDKDFSFGYSPLLVETVVDAMLQLLHDSEGPVILDMFNVNAIEAMQLRMVYFRDEENAKKLIELREKLLELCT